MDFFVQIVLFIVYLISSVEGYCSYSGYYECPDGVVVIPVLIIIAIIVTVIIYILRRQNCRKRMKEKRVNAILKAEHVKFILENFKMNTLDSSHFSFII
ncbi:hypothetical protein KUTeg_012280 [Tegillarca granosa]|uniref:Uncharacterized protein n=1 Tax=Tegillarca granosa TaxID=220873 RepID=A0ABQ9EZ25_TEGGR|nr:hypothetical protein KUTeg_012280 [Tegillarca granosa]